MRSLSVPHSVPHVQVNCIELPEGEEAAQEFLDEHLNCHKARVPGAGGEALVVSIHAAVLCTMY